MSVIESSPSSRPSSITSARFTRLALIWSSASSSASSSCTTGIVSHVSMQERTTVRSQAARGTRATEANGSSPTGWPSSTTGYVVTYARVWKTPTGRKIRLLASRPITFGESAGGTRSRDYSVSCVEMEINDKDMSKSTGTLYPAVSLKLKGKEIEVESFQNPWRLGNFLDWND